MGKKVLYDIRKDNGILFVIDDIVEIYSLKFRGVNTNKKILEAISNLNNKMQEIIETKVELYDERPRGTYAYKIKLLNGEVSIPIW